MFIPKYRKKILHRRVRNTLRDLIRQICAELDVEIISGKLTHDHVHLFISYPPNLSISKIVQGVKGKSSYKIYRLYPEVKKVYWGNHFWSRGYMAVSTGNITDEMIRDYIDHQEGEDLKPGNIAFK